ncbi:oxidoreductase [Enterococcus sp. LJL128]|uniref:oxidoreductase n=1 Tax=Enterococcus sp. LJL51 TaxID=3416656 RepID=UPI003CEAAC06
MKRKVVLITGASSGIGYKTAELLAQKGYKVYGAARRIEKIEPLRSLGVEAVFLDITNEESMTNAIFQIISKENRIDILINNAGYGSYGAIEDVSIQEAKNQFEVNLFGLARLTQLVLPHMRKQHFGRIINVSSMGGRLTTYFGAWYHATKYALEAFSDALRLEVKPFGIDVSIIEPGGIKTDWGIIAANKLKESSRGGVYEEVAFKVAEGMKKQYSSNLFSDPMIIAKTVGKAISKRKPKTRYLIGFGAKPLVFFKTILPDRLFDIIVKNVS